MQTTNIVPLTELEMDLVDGGTDVVGGLTAIGGGLVLIGGSLAVETTSAGTLTPLASAGLIAGISAVEIGVAILSN